MSIDLSKITHLTFDCYGTLVDWETGILSVLRPLFARHNRNLSDAGILELYGKLEWEQESGTYKTYREVLRAVTAKLASRLVLTLAAEDVDALSRSLPTWPVYPDTTAALKSLHSRYKLAIISNTDDDLFAGSAEVIGVKFDAVITAQQAHSYKPALNNFRLAMERTGAKPENILHVGQSVSHDIIPGKSLGLATAWVNRRPGTALFGNRPDPAKQPDIEVPSLEALADTLLNADRVVS